MGNKRIIPIKWSDFFEVKTNEMVVFRITPHATVTNNTNRKMWRMLSKMYEIYDKAYTRVEFERRSRLGFKVTYREKDTIWFDVIFRQDDGEKNVTFYTATSATWAKKYREILENYMRVTIEEVDISELEVPLEDTIIQELRYTNHDIFSLRTDATEQTSPIAGIMSALDDIGEDGDYARLSICNETMNRRRWISNASWAHEQIAKGKVPQRVRMTFGKFIRFLQTAVGGTANEVHSVMQDTMTAVERSFFQSENKEAVKEKLFEAKSLIDDIGGKVSKKTQEKLYQPVWKSRIRVAATADNRLRRDLIANTIAGAFSEIGENNELTGIKIRFGRRKELIEELNTLQLSKRTKNDTDVNLMSCDEMAKIALQLPTREIQMRYEDELSVNRKVETEIPSVVANNKGILAGHAEVKGEETPISIPLKNLDETFRSYGFVGSPRMGKDTLMKNIIVEGALHHGIGTVVIDAIMEDGERGLADGIRDALPPEYIIDLDLSDEDYYPPMDLTEVIKKLGRRGANRFAQEIIDFFGDVESMGQSRALLREFATAANGSIYEIKRLLESEELRVQRISELRAEGKERLANALDKWTSEYGEDAKGNIKLIKDGQKALDGKSAALYNRLDEFLGDETLFNIFAQDPIEELNFEQWMREGKVIILRVPNRKLGALATKTLVHWITLKVFMTKILMDPNEAKTFIVFNEPHQYLTPGLAALMRRIVLEGPKFRIAGLFAFHHFGLLKYGFDEDIASSAVNWFLFANDNKRVFEQLSEHLKPTFDVELAMETEAYHAIAILRFGGRRQHPFLMKALAPPSQRYPEYDNSFLTKRHSRVYGRKWTEVERMITEKERGVI
jgi:hypothetical protein